MTPNFMNIVLCDTCDLPATRELTYPTAESAAGIPVCASAACLSEAAAEVVSRVGPDVDTAVEPYPHTQPPPSTPFTDPQAFGLCRQNPAVAPRQVSASSGIGNSYTRLYGRCEDCGREFNTRARMPNPRCVVNDAPFAAERARLLAS